MHGVSGADARYVATFCAAAGPSAQFQSLSRDRIALVEEVPAPPSLVVLADFGGRPGQCGKCPQETPVGGM